MPRQPSDSVSEEIPQFDRHFFDGKQQFTRIGRGSIGGKAQGLATMKNTLAEYFSERPNDKISIEIPTLTVVASDQFEQFMKQNKLYDIAFSDLRDDQLALAFQKAELPPQMVGDLRALIAKVNTPLAIRSSSYLEDAMYQPFASVYTTKMLPNNQFDTDTRFRKLVEAIKFIYASTYFRGAKNYMQATEHTTAEEKMAVVIQAVVGRRFGDRFYPHISGVARSYNYYPVGHARPEQGVIDLALGLGKSIVDEAKAWSYCPAHPRAHPPYNSPRDLLRQTQAEFWAVNMGKPPAFDPIKETEYMMRCGIQAAESDKVLPFLASTYDGANDRIQIGVDVAGPRILTFAPILDYEQIPLNKTLLDVIKLCEDKVGTAVEIEFAVVLDPEYGFPAHFGFLQVRPMVISDAKIDLDGAELDADDLLATSQNVLGNGEVNTIQDIVYLKPDSFDTLKTRVIADEIEMINHRLVIGKRPYLLIGFGRWATSDPSLGVPVDFGQISGAKVIVESTLPDMYITLSQGSHFFHNMTSFKIMYFSVPHSDRHTIDWDWLARQNTVEETTYARWVNLSSPLRIRVDGRSGRGVIHR